MKHILIVLSMCCLTGLSCKKTRTVEVPQTGATIDLLSIIKINFNFSLFYHALQISHLDTLFLDSGQYTILLPDNTAFSNIGITADSPLDVMNKDSLRLWMQMHILPKAVPSGDIAETINTMYTSIGGQILYVTNNGTTIRANGDTLVSVDTKATNGYIHVLNKPLSLPWPSVKAFLLSDSNYSFFVAACGRFGLLDQLDSVGPYTLLAPLNSSFLAEGITLDTIDQLDTAQFRRYLFSVSILPAVRIYTADFSDRSFLLTESQPGNLPPSIISFVYPDHILINDVPVPPFNWAVMDPNRSQLNPNWGGPTVFLGPNSRYSVGLNQRGAGISDPDHHCANGVVHGLNDILIYPDSAKIQ